MALTTDQRSALATEFAQQVQINPDRVLELHDHIQRQGRQRPDLTNLCKFGRSMQVRRLKSVAPRNWNTGDWSNAQAILDEITFLLSQPVTHDQTLALAVLGVETPTLDEALRALLDEPDVENTDTPMGESVETQQAASPALTRPERQSGRGKHATSHK